MSVITFHSFKGGCGRSVGLANVAYYLASIGKKILCVDMDVESAGLLNVFNIRAQGRYNVIDLLIRPDFVNLDETLVNYKAATDDYTLDGELFIIPAAIDESAERIQSIPEGIFAAERFSDKLKEIQVTYNIDDIFIDTRSGICNSALFVNLGADIVVIFSRIDRQCQQGTKRLIDLFDKFAMLPKRVIVCNSIPDHPRIGQLLSNFRSVAGPIDVQIPYHPGLVVEEKIVFKEEDQANYSNIATNYKFLAKKIAEIQNGS